MRAGSRARQAAAAIWRRAKATWYAVALTVACMLFTASYWIDQRDAALRNGHLQEVAEEGGGLVVVYSGMECSHALGRLGDLTDRLQADGVPVVGLVFTDGVTERILRRAMRQAAERFPHKRVRWRTVRPIAEPTGTPMVVGVDAAGRIRFAEHFDSLLGNDEGESAHRSILARLDLSG